MVEHNVHTPKENKDIPPDAPERELPPIREPPPDKPLEEDPNIKDPPLDRPEKKDYVEV
ncbi:MAG: hypothetical protein K0S08_986 [Gammaproteobacteria bacterium]|nr:hypothetical protein [Gammaproteobacteria bacterium]